MRWRSAFHPTLKYSNRQQYHIGSTNSVWGLLLWTKVRKKHNSLTCGKVYWLLLKLDLTQWHSRELFGRDSREGESLKIAKTNICEHLRANMFNATFKGTASKLLMGCNPEAKSLGRKYEIWNYMKYSCKLVKLYSLLNFYTCFQEQIVYK